MLSNLYRGAFWAVFLPLLVAAGLFWLGEMRGYRSEISLFVLSRTETTVQAPATLVVLAQSTPFATTLYERHPEFMSPLLGKTAEEQKSLWQKQVNVESVKGSAVILIRATGDERHQSETLARAVAREIESMADRFYGLGNGIDIRPVEGPLTTPLLSFWPRFAGLSFLTALAFTILFFGILRSLDWVFPKRAKEKHDEYVISAETFKPKKPAYWTREENGFIATKKKKDEPVIETLDDILEPTIEEKAAWEEEGFQEAGEKLTLDDTVEGMNEDEYPVNDDAFEPAQSEIEEVPESTPLPEEIFAPTEPELDQSSYSKAAAPDNLPIVDAPLSPLQGAQARLMKADIDAASRERAFELEDDTPLTHEPTAEDYKRRLNELLSGKM